MEKIDHNDPNFDWKAYYRDQFVSRSKAFVLLLAVTLLLLYIFGGK